MFLQSVQQFLPSCMKFGPAPLFNAEMLADPYPTYEHLRREHPIYWDAADDRWVLTRYADITTVLRSPVVSSERSEALGRFVPPGFRQLMEYRSNSMINTDGDRHNRLRLLVSKAFTARAVEAMTGKIQNLVDEFLKPVRDRGHMDVIADLAYPLPVTVIAEMLGVPAEDRERFKHWSDDLALGAGSRGSPTGMRIADYRRISASYTGVTEYLGRIADERRSEPRNDLLTALVQAEEAGDRLNESELFANAILLLVAGNETTTNLIGNGTLALLRNPDQWERLRADPSLIPAAVEELLRYDSPVQFTSRLLRDDLTVSGTRLRRGEMVLLLLGAGNRDPEVFADPDRLDVGRADNKHLSFGLGSHFCLGAQLARLEARLAFETLVRQFPALHLKETKPRFRNHFNLRGLEALPVGF